jgi:hypothetical protein
VVGLEVCVVVGGAFVPLLTPARDQVCLRTAAAHQALTHQHGQGQVASGGLDVYVASLVGGPRARTQQRQAGKQLALKAVCVRT